MSSSQQPRYQRLQEVAEQVKTRLATYPTVFDIADSMSDGKEELQIELTEQGLALGLNRVDVSQQVRNSFFGAQAQRIQRGRDDVTSYGALTSLMSAARWLT